MATPRKQKRKNSIVAQLQPGPAGTNVVATSMKALSDEGALTVVYCHGIGNKPPESALRSLWDRALFGVDQGERTRMAYWVDRERYPGPETIGSKSLSTAEFTVAGVNDLEAERLLRASIQESDDAVHSEKLVKSLEAEMLRRAGGRVGGNLGAQSLRAKGLWSPITAIFTRLFLADVNDFLYHKAKRDRMVQTVKDRILTGGGPFVVIAHSQGSMVAWQALMELGASARVSLLVTIGSPLGLPQVRGELKKWHGKQLSIPPGVERWINVARDGDIVCADKTLGNEYVRGSQTVEDYFIDDWALMPKAHNVVDYLVHRYTREPVLATVRTDRFQPVSKFTIARDLTASMDETPEEPHPVLIELIEPELDIVAAGGTTNHSENPADIVEDWILRAIHENLRGGASESAQWRNVEFSALRADELDELREKAQLERLHRYAAAVLTRTQVEQLAWELGNKYGREAPRVYRVFKNSRKRALAIDRPLQPGLTAIQAPTAQLGYKALGQGITWAVLDTGVDQGHPHFDTPYGRTVSSAWECTKRGSPVPFRDPLDRDLNGHGTHVAGIIAGGLDPERYPGLQGITSVAPRAHIVSYKVLANDGEGRDAWIIKAIDHIWEQNERARRLLIQGVNLSLGGPFDATSFGCGDSPLCASLLRLHRQGVVVVLAAGNEGVGEILVDGTPMALSLDLSIGDPANLDEGIAVGSVHPSLPHRYGTSYFSSRGPTSDGRLKPDVVAPGERILSCRSRRSETVGMTVEELYVELSGTSMAAPHVSGLLAAFLSVRTEFIGYPDRIKRILLEHCTDLKRDRYHQGAGLPNLTKMLLQT